jgi:hypothetical protein
LVIAIDDSVRNAAKAAAFTVKPTMKAGRMTTSPVIEPSTNPATTSMIGSFFKQALQFLANLGTLFKVAPSRYR